MAAAVSDLVGSAFLAPIFLGFLGLIPVVILLYLLKLRRTEIVIPSTMLWLKSLHDLTANAPFQRLRKNLLLFLQILILLLVVAALARPFVRAEGVVGTNLCVLIDHSASMQTQEGDVTRLDLAKEGALEMVDALKGGDKMMVVAFAEKAQVLCEFTDDRVHLRRAIRSITPSDTRTRIRAAMLVARSLVPENREELTTEGGLDIVNNATRIRTIISKLKTAGIPVSLFLDPTEDQIQCAIDLEVDAIELHTGAYAESLPDKQNDRLHQLVNAATLVDQARILLNAGHGLTYNNVQPIASISGMHELNIGHSIIARSIFTGLENAVSEMKRLVSDSYIHH